MEKMEKDHNLVPEISSPHRRLWLWWEASLQDTRSAWCRTWTPAGCSARVKVYPMRPAPAASRPEQPTKASGLLLFFVVVVVRKWSRQEKLLSPDCPGNKLNDRIWIVPRCRLSLPLPLASHFSPQSCSPLLHSSQECRTPQSHVAGEWQRMVSWLGEWSQARDLWADLTWMVQIIQRSEHLGMPLMRWENRTANILSS